MLEAIMERQIIFYIVGGVAAFGIIAKLISGISLKRLVKAAGNMSKSTHPLMRLVRAKFEHACMVSDRVQNISAFVDKYLYEYKVCGLRLHSWRQLQKGLIWMSGILSVFGMSVEYYYQGMWINFYNYAMIGGITTGFLLLLYVSTDETYKMNIAKTYMVDFLENTYAHRYEKNLQKEIQVTVQKADTEESGQKAPVQSRGVEELQEVPAQNKRVGEQQEVSGQNRRTAEPQEAPEPNKRSEEPQEIPVQNKKIVETNPGRRLGLMRREMEPRKSVVQGGQTVQAVQNLQKKQEFEDQDAAWVEEQKGEGMKEAKIREILEEFLA